MVKLSDNKIETLKKTIAQQFPEMKNVEPIIEAKEIIPHVQTAAKLGINMKRTAVRRQQVHIATFGTQIKAEDGSTIQKVIRATLDEDGNIIRISHSK
ncbi:MAG: hypothetical protein GTO02_20010 [Candidatus Dadabacteria bacterium]|nr:hypothetical protein [Candidatus Dadabacteria bacterium]NIQ16583.1 hypothetical protein [Candidatus Dadabacteria bacterium]